MAVESAIPTLLAFPPPETLARFTCGELAFAATFTVTIMGGYTWPAASTSLRVQVLPAQVHPAPGATPVIDTRVSPEGSVSVTVTVPNVGLVALWFVTVMV